MKYKYMKVVDVGHTPEGKRIQKRFYGNTKAELERRIYEYRKEADRVAHPSNATFGEYSQKWLNAYKSARSSNTKAMYGYALDKFESINGIPIGEIRTIDLQQALNKYIEHPRTCQVLRLTLNQIFKHALNDGIITANPVTALELPRYTAKEKRALSEAEKEAVRNAELPEMHHLFLMLIYHCGLRRGEALALQKKDFDLSNRTISISKAVAILPNGTSELKGTKTEDARVVPFPASILAEIKAYLKTDNNLFLFHKLNGEMMNLSSYRRFWGIIYKEINRQLGGTKDIDATGGLSAHIFRHNYATMCYYSGISMKKAAALMGHSDTKMIMNVYAHLDDEQEDIASLMDSLAL